MQWSIEPLCENLPNVWGGIFLWNECKSLPLRQPGGGVSWSRRVNGCWLTRIFLPSLNSSEGWGVLQYVWCGWFHFIWSQQQNESIKYLFPPFLLFKIFIYVFIYLRNEVCSCSNGSVFNQLSDKAVILGTITSSSFFKYLAEFWTHWQEVR